MPYRRNHRQRANAWTAAEDDALRLAYGTISAYAVGKKLGRTEAAVWMRARALGLDKRLEVHHPWTEDDLADLRRSYSAETASAIAIRLGRTADAVRQQARVLGLVSKKTLVMRSAISDYFRRIKSAEQAYILGLLAADGNVGDDGKISLGLHAKDKHLVEFVQSRLAPAHTLCVAKRNAFVSFSFTSHSMVQDLAHWGIVPRKSRIITWPAALGELQRPYLLGYFDGDGSASLAQRDNGRVYPVWSVCSGSETFLMDLKEYVRGSTAVELDQIQRRPNVSLYQVSVLGSGAYAVDKWLHQDRLGLARKRYPAEALERYKASLTPGRTKNGVAAWRYDADTKEAAVEALHQARKAQGGVEHGDITRVAETLGIDRGNLRRWAIQAGEPI